MPQRFMEGVRDHLLRRDLFIVYASESFLADPPTVESLRFTTRQLQRNRPKATQLPHYPRLAMRSRPHSFVPQQPTFERTGRPGNSAAGRLLQLWTKWAFCSRMPHSGSGPEAWWCSTPFK